MIITEFKDTHGMIQTSIRRQTDPRLKTTIYGTQKAENLFYNLQNENYTSRPVQLFIVQGFNISSAYPNIMVTTTPSLDFNDILSVNVYIRAIHGPINSINIEILTLCTKIDNCLTPQTLPDIESEFSIQYYSGIKSIGDFVGGNATMNYTFKTFLSQPPKYLLSGVTNGLVTGYDSIFGFSLLNYSKRGYSILLEAGALSPITWGYIFYFYSNWGKFLNL